MEKSLPYVGKPMEQMTIGVQRLAVVFPAEEQVDMEGAVVGDEVTGDTVVRDNVVG